MRPDESPRLEQVELGARRGIVNGDRAGERRRPALLRAAAIRSSRGSSFRMRIIEWKRSNKSLATMSAGAAAAAWTVSNALRLGTVSLDPHQARHRSRRCVGFRGDPSAPPSHAACGSPIRRPRASCRRALRLRLCARARTRFGNFHAATRRRRRRLGGLELGAEQTRRSARHATRQHYSKRMALYIRCPERLRSIEQFEGRRARETVLAKQPMGGPRPAEGAAIVAVSTTPTPTRLFRRAIRYCFSL